MITNRAFLFVLITAAYLPLRAADQGFTNMEPYLPKAQPENRFSLSGDAERFRSYAQMDKAYRLFQAGQFELARKELLPLVERAPENSRAGYLYLSVLYRLGNYAEVIRQANLLLARQPHFIPALLYRSRAYVDTSQLKEAIAGFETLQYSSLKPADRVSVLATLGDLCIRAKDYSGASSATGNLLALEKSYQAWFRMGLAEDGLNNPAEATRAYRSALELANTPAQRLKALQAIAESLRKEKEWRAVRDTLLQALQINPRETSVLRSLAETEYQLRDYPETEEYLHRLLTLQPDVKQREFLANILVLRKNWLKAEAEYTALVSGEKDPAARARIYRALSQIAENTGNNNQSADYLKRALALESSFHGQEKLASLFIEQAKLLEADSVLTDLAKEARSPENKQRVLLTLGQVKLDEKQYAAAAGVFADAVRVKGDIRALSAASNAAEQAHDIAAAAGYAFRAASLTPSADAYLRVGRLQGMSGDLAGALRSFESAAKQPASASQKIETYKQIAFIYVHNGDYEQARRWYEQAVMLDPADANLQREVGFVLVHMKLYADAALHFKQVLAIGEMPGDRRWLASAQEMAGQMDAAISTYAEGLHRPANSDWGEIPFYFSSMAELERKRGNDARAAEIYKEYLATPSLPARERAHVLESLGAISSKLGQNEAAADYFARAIDTGAASASAHEDLGFVLYRLSRWRPALDAFLASPSSAINPVRLIAIANCYRKLEKPGLAIHYLDQALDQKKTLTPAEQHQAYADLGYLYADTHDYPAAIEAWENAQHMQSTSAVGLSLARVKRLAGNPAAAIKQLNQIRPDTLDKADQAQYFDELAQAYSQVGRLEDSRRAWEAANRIESTAARNYQIGLDYSNAGQVEEAIPYLERAAKSSANSFYLQSLAYAYKSVGRLNDAVLCFEKVAAATPVNIDIYKELAYLEMRLAHNASAERWFRKAIDAQPQPEHQQTTAAFEGADKGLREDFARLENRYNVTLYDGYSSDPQVLTTALGPTPGSNAITPAGGGIELDYQPPGIGFRNERTLQVFTRATWSNQSSSLVVQSRSEQMGLGVRYKPLISQNLQLSLERLIPLGSGLQPNWMARAMSSWSAGYDLRPDRRGWNYSLLFVDTALLLQAPRTAAELAQFRQGISFRVGQTLLITPHLLAAARHQSPVAAAGTYLEAGGGLSLRFLLRDSYDQPRKSNFELLVDCHRGTLITQPTATSYHGCRASGILRF